MRRSSMVLAWSLLFGCGLSACSGGSTPQDGGGGGDVMMSNDSDSMSQDSGSTPDADASPSDGGAGDVANDPDAMASGTVTFSIRTDCPAFNACGGDPTGEWIYTGACVSDPFPEVRMACPGATIVSAMGTVTGGVTFAGNTVRRNISVDVTGTFDLPASCTLGSCAAAQAQLMAVYSSTSCSPMGTSCRCTVAGTIHATDGGTYTVSGGTLTVDAGGSQSQYDFCVQGGTLTYRSSGGGAVDPGILTLSHP